VITLVSSGLNVPRGIAVDAAGNVYIADTGNNAIKEWIAGSGAVITLVSSGLNAPRGLAVDVSGNVYIADSSDNAVKEWIATTGTVVALPLTGLSNPRGVAVDASGDVFVADTSNMAIKKLPYAFVDPTPIEIPAGVGFGALPVILPNTQNLVSPYTPVSSRPWLYVGLVFNGQVNFAYPFNAGPTNRTGNITVLGQSISITQAAPPYISTVAKTGSTTFELSFTNLDMSSTYSVLATTNLTSPLSNWTVLGTASNVGGVLQFIDPHPTNSARFYMIRSP